MEEKEGSPMRVLQLNITNSAKTELQLRRLLFKNVELKQL